MAKKEVMNECIEELVKAIILQAVEDYRMALRILAQDQEKTEEGTIQWAKRMKRDVEKFFCSGWFEMMSEADGKNILREVRAIERDQAIREGAWIPESGQEGRGQDQETGNAEGEPPDAGYGYRESYMRCQDSRKR